MSFKLHTTIDELSTIGSIAELPIFNANSINKIPISQFPPDNDYIMK